MDEQVMSSLSQKLLGTLVYSIRILCIITIAVKRGHVLFEKTHVCYPSSFPVDFCTTVFFSPNKTPFRLSDL